PEMPWPMRSPRKNNCRCRLAAASDSPEQKTSRIQPDKPCRKAATREKSGTRVSAKAFAASSRQYLATEQTQWEEKLFAGSQGLAHLKDILGLGRLGLGQLRHLAGHRIKLLALSRFRSGQRDRHAGVPA